MWKDIRNDPPVGPLKWETVLAWSETKRGGYMLWTPEMNGETMMERVWAHGVTHWQPLPAFPEGKTPRD